MEEIGLNVPLGTVRGDTECDLLGGEYGFGIPNESDLHSINGLVLPRFGLGLPMIKSKIYHEFRSVRLIINKQFLFPTN